MTAVWTAAGAREGLRDHSLGRRYLTRDQREMCARAIRQAEADARRPTVRELYEKESP